MPINLAEYFFQRAALQPNHPLLLEARTENSITYGAFQQQVQQLAAQLQQAGCRQGMNIGLHYPNGLAYITLTYALWASGACVTPIPVELAAEEKQHIFQYIALDAVISEVKRSDMLTPFLNGASIRLTAQASLFPLKLMREPPTDLYALNPAFIRFTSGTTGDAKGVVLSHETIYERIQAANQALQISPQDRIVWLLSMAYHFAVSIVAYLTFGATIILPKNTFGISLLQAAQQHQATIIYGAPTHYELMTHDRTRHPLPDSLRLAIVTTARLNSTLAETFDQRFGIALNETYGIIEVGLPAINLQQPRAKQGSVGPLLPAYTLKLVERPDAEAGEILLNGPGLLDAYYEPWQSRQTLLHRQGGWLATGDLGRLDEAGFLTIVGRSKEMISVAGMKFFPQEVEKVLEAHPAIHTACVFGMHTVRLGETPVAHLICVENVKQPTDAELKAYCHQHLASYKIPTQFSWVAQLARTASGKLIRNADKLLT